MKSYHARMRQSYKENLSRNDGEEEVRALFNQNRMLLLSESGLVGVNIAHSGLF